jgi:tripartite-type tricarboxylate transporter receptor subunit TctC
MLRMIRVLALPTFALIAALTWPPASNAQSYPSKPIRIIVGYPPGAGIDFTARLFAERLKTALGQPVLVENKAGAGGELAAEYVSRSDPDGYTLMYAVGSDLVWTKFLTRRATVDPLKDLTPIATVISSVNCVAVNAAFPIKSFEELVEFTRANPGKLTYGTAGIQSYYYLIGEALKQHGIDMLHVPYKGNAPVVSALLSREIDVALTTLASVAAHVESGTVKPLAVMEAKRYPGVPEVPAISEVLPTFDAPLSWFGFFGPPGMSQEVLRKLHAEISQALSSTEIRDKIKSLNLNIFPTTASEVRPLIMESTETFGRLIKSTNIKPID